MSFPVRLPAHVETTAYFVVAEALTNAVKHARPSGANVRAAVRHGALELEIRDGGVGGAGNPPRTWERDHPPVRH